VPQRFLVIIKRSPSDGTYNVAAVQAGPRHGGDLHARAPDATAVLQWLGSSLTSIFQEGDTIEFANVEYGSVAKAIEGVRVARVDWERT
jgi:hypothetical protein